MFGADNCRASVPQPGTQFGIAGGLAWGTAYRTAHLAPAGLEIFHYTLFKMYLNPALPKNYAESFFLATFFGVCVFFKESFLI